MGIQSSKSEKTSRKRSSSHLQAWFMANGLFSDAAKNGTIFSRD